MRPQKAHKIALNKDYPCPCRRRGRLLPIILTEAFGCDRCQQIFVLDEKTQTIEQLSSIYAYKRLWRWNGHRWLAVHPGLRESYLPILIGIALVLLIVWLPLALRSPASSIIIWAILAVLLATLPALIVWLAYRG